MYNQRDIVIINFPYSDLTAAKQRPALIISNKKLKNSEDKICCLITSNPFSEGIKIEKSAFVKGDLPLQSWIKPYRLFTIHEKTIKRKLCTVTEKFHQAVISSLNTYINGD